ncbi:MAG: hypothetical protein A2287_04495 [Candidatus Melainabacteria bacterium RIFOXYA12_FULL_32_12]|nr:MAG: hypothetical protein A2287_04495 [Candidatus Melainabacteria bacterium RIFOXYA12_FULL_32_12]
MTHYKNALTLIFSFLVIFTLAGCSKNEEAKSIEIQENIINVETFNVIKKQIRPSIDSIGSLESFEEVIVSAETSGALSRVNFREGSLVGKGTILAYVEPTDYRLRVESAQAALKQAQAYYENIKTEHMRKKTLYEKEVISRQQYDDAATRLTVASSDIDQARSSLALARQELNKTVVSSPINGFIKEKKVASGDYVSEGTALFEIIQTNPLKLTFTIPEEKIGKIKQGQEVTFTVNAYPDKEFKGTIKTIYPNIEEQTRNLKIEALVNNTKGELKPGMFAKAKIYTENIKNVLMIPSVALLFDDTEAKVFKIEANVAKATSVKIGEKYGEMVEILQGLQENQPIIVTGQQNLSEGVKINVAR